VRGIGDSRPSRRTIAVAKNGTRPVSQKKSLVVSGFKKPSIVPLLPGTRAVKTPRTEQNPTRRGKSDAPVLARCVNEVIETP
jgi:hypothetical protein